VTENYLETWQDRSCLSENQTRTNFARINGGLSYLEVEDDGPDEAEGELGVPVHDVLAADVDQLDLLVPQEPQRGLHVLDRVEPHPASLSRQYFS